MLSCELPIENSLKEIVLVEYIYASRKTRGFATSRRAATALLRILSTNSERGNGITTVNFRQ